MQEGQKKTKLPNKDNQKLVDAFTWLIEEDKKQNPALYKPKRKNERWLIQ